MAMEAHNRHAFAFPGVSDGTLLYAGADLACGSSEGQSEFQRPRRSDGDRQLPQPSEGQAEFRHPDERTLFAIPAYR